jgi:RNA polymerase sigma factor (TIGR02999 family)
MSPDRLTRSSGCLAEAGPGPYVEPVPASPGPSDVTLLLQQWSGGDRSALDRILPIVYQELHRQAARYLRRERAGHTLQATALVHEAYLRLVDQRRVQWQNRAHFFGIAAQLMRRVLVDHARARGAAKRGGGGIQVTLEGDQGAVPGADVNLIALDQALTRLAQLDPTQARLVELRYFTGLNIEEAAETLGISPATLKREWVVARAWLRRELEGTGQEQGPPAAGT